VPPTQVHAATFGRRDSVLQTGHRFTQVQIVSLDLAPTTHMRLELSVGCGTANPTLHRSRLPIISQRRSLALGNPKQSWADDPSSCLALRVLDTMSCQTCGIRHGSVLRHAASPSPGIHHPKASHALVAWQGAWRSRGRAVETWISLAGDMQAVSQHAPLCRDRLIGRSVTLLS